MLLSFIVTAITSFVIFFFLPSGVRQGRYQEFFGVTKDVWSAIHVWFGMAMILIVILHFVLHWNWIVCMTKTIFKRTKKNKKNKDKNKSVREGCKE